MRLHLALLVLLAISPFAHSADACAGAAHANGEATTALRKCRSAAESGNAESQYAYGSVLSNGQGRFANQAEALEWLRRSARQAHLRARVTLGRFLTSDDLAAPLRIRAEGYAWWVVAGEQAAAGNLESTCRLPNSLRANGS